jgi:hypothetical protein
MRDKRKASRKKYGTNAWIRLDGGFAVRSCKVLDMSDSGVQIEIDDAKSVSNEFSFLTSRTAGTGRRARIKWRRGAQIGAQFL